MAVFHQASRLAGSKFPEVLFVCCALNGHEPLVQIRGKVWMEVQTQELHEVELFDYGKAISTR